MEKPTTYKVATQAYDESPRAHGETPIASAPTTAAFRVPARAWRNLGYRLVRAQPAPSPRARMEKPGVFVWLHRRASESPRAHGETLAGPYPAAYRQRVPARAWRNLGL